MLAQNADNVTEIVGENAVNRCVFSGLVACYARIKSRRKFEFVAYIYIYIYIYIPYGTCPGQYSFRTMVRVIGHPKLIYKVS